MRLASANYPHEFVKGEVLREAIDIVGSTWDPLFDFNVSKVSGFGSLRGTHILGQNRS